MTKKKGIVLVFILMAAVFAGIIAYSFFTISYTSIKSEELRRCETQALKTADSGINYVLFRLNTDYSLGIGMSSTFSGTDGQGNYTTTLTRIDDELYKANSVSTYSLGGNECSKEVEVYIIKRIKSIFTFGLFSNKDLKFVGNPLIDSYDSDDGSYQTQATNIDTEHGGILYADDEGDIGTNENIILDGNVKVYGDASYGPTGSIYYGLGSYITGETTGLSEQITLPSFDFPPPPSSNNNDQIPRDIYNPGQNKIQFTSGTYSLPPGTYYLKEIKMSSSAKLIISAGSTIYITDSLSLMGNANITTAKDVTIAVVGDTTISGNGTISVNGATKFYGGGSFQITGNGFVNTLEKPDQLQVYLSTNTYTTPNQVILSGNADYYGTVYAPYAYVHIGGNAQTYGSIIANEIKYNGNASFHYDEDLEDIKFGFQYWSIASWIKKK
ncbi:MAG: hypothetical protein ACK4NF_02700 [Planctomycetota bacterium]